MGAWSHEPFGNDSAADWSYGLADCQDTAYIETALDAVLGDEDYLDADAAVEAVAAAEVIAKMLGKGTQADAYTESADIWVAAMSTPPSAALRAKAVRALDRITAGESELAELWADSEDDAAWLESMATLRAAVAA
jgi:hypothetical protein